MTEWTLTEMAERGAVATFATWPTARRVEVARNVLVAADVPALLAEVERLRGALNVLVPVAELYVSAFTDSDRLSLTEALRLTEVRDTLAALHPQEPSGD